MDEMQKLIQQMREAENSRHLATMRKIDELASINPPAKEPPKKTDPKSLMKGSNQTKEQKGQPKGNVERVFDVLDDEFKTVEEISSLSGLDEKKVRGVLGSKSTKDRIEMKRIEKRARYRKALKAR